MYLCRFMEDSALLLRLIGGDHTALRTLAQRYTRALTVFATRLAGRMAAPDIVQDAFEALWRRHGALDPSGAVGAWLYATVRNRCLAYLRARRVSDIGGALFLPDDEDIEVAYIETETIRRLHEAVGTLPPRTAEVIRLGLQGLRQVEIAAHMGVALVTVKVMKAEAIKKLKLLLN